MYTQLIENATKLAGENALQYCIDKDLLAWYVITNNTSWCDVEKAIHSGPYTTKDEAKAKCLDASMWPELMSAEEAEAITY